MGGAEWVAIVSIVATAVVSPFLGAWLAGRQSRRTASRADLLERRRVVDEAAATESACWWRYNQMLFHWDWRIPAHDPVAADDDRSFNAARSDMSQAWARMAVRFGTDSPVVRSYGDLIGFSNGLREFLNLYEKGEPYDKREVDEEILVHREYVARFLNAGNALFVADELQLAEAARVFDEGTIQPHEG